MPRRAGSSSKVKACQAIDAISTGIQAFLARVAWAAPARTNEASASDATDASFISCCGSRRGHEIYNGKHAWRQVVAIPLATSDTP
jgi:hypothetical protein